MELDRKELYNYIVKLKSSGLAIGEVEKEIGAFYGKSPRTIRRWISELRLSWSVPNSSRPLWTDVVHLTGEKVALYADLHCDFHDAAFVEKAIKRQVEEGVTQAVIVGDGVDFQLLSPYIPEPNASFEREAEALRVIVNNINSVSPDGCVYIEGNHEARLFKALKRAIGMREFLDMVGIDDDVIASDYRYCYWNNWRICHPNQFRAVKGSLAKDLIAKHHCHIAVAHMHRFCHIKGTGGHFIGLELGMMADSYRLAYYQKAETTSPAFEKAFTIIEKKGNCYEIKTQ